MAFVFQNGTSIEVDTDVDTYINKGFFKFTFPEVYEISLGLLILADKLRAQKT